MPRTPKPDPRIEKVHSRIEKAHVDFEKHYRRMLRAINAMERCRGIIKRGRKQLRTLEAEPNGQTS
jgi:hypothetical protein